MPLFSLACSPARTHLDVHEIVQLGGFGLLGLLVSFLEAPSIRIHFAILKQFQLFGHLDKFKKKNEKEREGNEM